MEPNPIKALFRSRKFLLALFAVVQSLVAHYLEVPPAVWQSIDLLVGVLIASIAYEDGAAKGSPVNVQTQNVNPPEATNLD